MDVGAAFQSHSLLGFSMCFSFTKQRYLGHSYISMREVAVQVQPSPFALEKAISPCNNSSITSEGGKSVQTSRRNNDKRTRTFDGKQSRSHDQEEIIALIKRIRVSISKKGTPKTGKRSSNADKERRSTESNRDILDKSNKQVEAGNVSNFAKEKQEQEAQEHQHASGFKLPIPVLSPPRGNNIEITNDASPAIKVDAKVESGKLEELRLADLKELAKTRGIKGYSKLKKGELIKILGS